MDKEEADVAILRENMLAQMATIEDASMRSIFSLLIQMVDINLSFQHRVINKIDAVLRDEARIKEIVLNGHVTNHRQHHDWIQENLINTDKLKHVIRLSEGHRMDGVYCKWAADKIEEEKRLKYANKTSIRNIFEKVFYALLVFGSGVFFHRLLEFLGGV